MYTASLARISYPLPYPDNTAPPTTSLLRTTKAQLLRSAMRANDVAYINVLTSAFEPLGLNL